MMLNRLILFCKQMTERQRLLLLLSVAFCLRLYSVLMAKGIAIDGAYYGFMARDFLKGHFAKGLSQPFHPFYPLLISLVAPDAAHVEMAGRLISLIFGTATLALVYYIAKEVVEEKAAVLSALFYCFHPHLVTFSGMLLSESTYGFFLTLSAFFFWIGLKGRKLLESMASGLFLGLAYLTRPEGIGYLVVFVPWALLYGGLRKGWSKKIAIVSGFIFVFMVLALPYVVQTHRETGRWMISRKATDAQTRFLAWTTEGKGQVEKGAIQKQKAAGKGRKLPVPVRNVFRYAPLTAYHYLRAYHYALWIFLLFGLIRKRQQGVQAELFMASIVLFHILSLATFTSSSQRFSVPVVPLSLFWAGAGVLTFRGFLKRNIPPLEQWLVGWIIVTLVFLLVQSLRPERMHREEQREIGIWLKQNTPEEAVIMSNSPQEAFYANREFIALPPNRSIRENPGTVYREVMDFARKNRVRYILVNGNTREHNPDFFESIGPTELIERYRYNDRSGNAAIVYEVVY